MSEIEALKARVAELEAQLGAQTGPMRGEVQMASSASISSAFSFFKCT